MQRVGGGNGARPAAPNTRGGSNVSVQCVIFYINNVQGGDRGRGTVPVNIRPTHYVSVLSVYYSVQFMFIKVNVQQSGGVVPNVRSSSNVEQSGGGVTNIRPSSNVSVTVIISVFVMCDLLH